MQGWTSNERSLRSRRIFAANANRTNANRLPFANKRTRTGPHSHNRTRIEAIRVRLLANKGLLSRSDTVGGLRAAITKALGAHSGGTRVSPIVNCISYTLSV